MLFAGCKHVQTCMNTSVKITHHLLSLLQSVILYLTWQRHFFSCKLPAANVMPVSTQWITNARAIFFIRHDQETYVALVLLNNAIYPQGVMFANWGSFKSSNKENKIHILHPGQPEFSQFNTNHSILSLCKKHKLQNKHDLSCLTCSLQCHLFTYQYVSMQLTFNVQGLKQSSQNVQHIA